MKVAKVLGWVFIPYFMVIFAWKRLKPIQRGIALTWIAIIVIGGLANINGDQIQPVTNPIVESAHTNETKNQKEEEAAVNEEIVSANLGEPLTSFDKKYGKGKDGALISYKDDYVLVIPMDDKVWNITVQFEATDDRSRTKDEALAIADEFIPSDAVKVKEWQIEQGKEVIQFTSESLASKFDKSVFGDTPTGTFCVIVKSNEEGVFSLVIAPGTEAKPETEPATQAVEPIIHIKEIAGKTEEEIAVILGKPIYTEEKDFGLGPNFEKVPVTMHYYKEMLEGDLGRVEIMFVDGAARRIRLNLIGVEFKKVDELKQNLAYIDLPIVELKPAENELQKQLHTGTIEGLFNVSVGEWLGTEDGSVFVVTEEKYN